MGRVGGGRKLMKFGQCVYITFTHSQSPQLSNFLFFGHFKNQSPRNLVKKLVAYSCFIFLFVSHSLCMYTTSGYSLDFQVHALLLQ